MGFIKNVDGSITRIPDFIPATPPSPDPSIPLPVLTKDVYLNLKTQTSVRVYLPRPESTKLPLVFYYHGGGFVIASAASTMFHKFCCDLVRHIPAVMVSVDYRLAPEHRLPAAYDDCMEALHWARTTDDEWLTKHVDFSKCFLMGTSSGGNIAYQMALRMLARADSYSGLSPLEMPLKIQGLILHQPYFGGVQRTPSEIRLAHNMVIPLIITDIIWDLALPVGANRDHEYSNPMKHVREEVVEKMKNEGWRFLTTGYDDDPLVDRQMEVVKMLRERGIDVMEKFSEGGFHGVEFSDEAKATIFYGVVREFILSF